MVEANIENVYAEADGKIAIDFGGEEVLLTHDEAIGLYIDLGFVLQDLNATFTTQQKVIIMQKAITAKIIVNPIGRQNLQFRRTTNQYGPKGSFSSNQGYLSVSRLAAGSPNGTGGNFCSRPKV